MGVDREHERSLAEDRALARRIEGGDREAFVAFFEENVRGLYRFAHARLAGDLDHTREVVQTSFCKALDSLGSYRGEGSLVAWLYGICRFEISAHYRQARRRAGQQSFHESAPEVQRASAEASERAQPEQALLRRERARGVHEALDRLPSRYASALEWKYVEGLSLKEVGQRLHVTPKAAESLLARARAALRRRMSMR